MRFDFSQVPLTNRAFSETPMAFCEIKLLRNLSMIIELAAVETGNRKAREHWQSTQLRNLLGHVVAKSTFWRQRIGTKKAIGDLELSSLPILTRGQVREQVKSEGSLITSSNQIRVESHATSGSTGVPVKFFISTMNIQYNTVRYATQFFIEGRDLTLNRTRLRPQLPQLMSNSDGFTVKKTDFWFDGTFIKSGTNKQIDFFRPNIDLLRKELELDSIGYLVAQPHIIETMLQYFDPVALKRAGMAMWIPLAAPVDPKLREAFASINIPVRANYSSEEVGLIGSECEKFSGNYHVATSNVIVEVNKDEPIQVGDKQLGRVLVTHLHSYATPFIRYDLGDLASLAVRCSCGHDGPTLSDVYGRSKNLLKHPDGRVSPFHIRGYELSNITKFEEYRIKQTDVKTIVVEIGGRESLTADEIASFTRLIKAHAGDGFEVIVRPVSKIEWGHSVKRLGFYSEVL